MWNEEEVSYTVFFKDREANSANQRNSNLIFFNIQNANESPCTCQAECAIIEKLVIL